jgi:hypothetical protein
VEGRTAADAGKTALDRVHFSPEERQLLSSKAAASSVPSKVSIPSILT